MAISWSSLSISFLFMQHTLDRKLNNNFEKKKTLEKNVCTRSHSLNSMLAIMSEPINCQPVINIPVCTRNPSIFIDRMGFMTKIEIIRIKYAIVAYILFSLKIHDYLDQPLNMLMMIGRV